MSQSNHLFTYKWWLINFCLSGVQMWFLRCGDSCAPVGRVSLCLERFSWDPCLGACVDLSDVLSVNTAGMIFILNPSVSGEMLCWWRKLRFDEWMSVNYTHFYVSGLDLTNRFTYCLVFLLHYFYKLLAIPSSLNYATFQMPLRKCIYQC